MPDDKNPYEAFRQENARVNISTTKDIDDPEDVIQQDQIDRNRIVPAMTPITADEEAEGSPSK